MSPSYKDHEWEDESYDVVDFLIDNDPIELGAQMRRCERSLRTTLEHLRWTLMELGPEPPWTDPSPLLNAWTWLMQSEAALGEPIPATGDGMNGLVAKSLSRFRTKDSAHPSLGQLMPDPTSVTGDNERDND